MYLKKTFGLFQLKNVRTLYIHWNMLTAILTNTMRLFELLVNVMRACDLSRVRPRSRLSVVITESGVFIQGIVLVSLSKPIICIQLLYRLWKEYTLPLMMSTVHHLTQHIVYIKYFNVHYRSRFVKLVHHRLDNSYFHAV